MGGSLTNDELLKACKKACKNNNNKIFVETGTYKGTTTIQAARFFDTVYTTEIKKELWKEAKQNAEKEKMTNINFLLGDSLVLLEEKIMPKIRGREVVFFLDAHQSGPDTSNNNKQLVPLIEELKIILSVPLGPSVFILDDLRFWKGQVTPAWDWAHISVQDVLKLFVEYGQVVNDFYTENDRLWIFT